MKKFYGVTRNQDLDPVLLVRDTRPFSYKAVDYFRESGQTVIMVLAALVFINPFLIQFGIPLIHLEEPLFLVGLVFALFTLFSKKTYDYATPMLKGKNGKITGDGNFCIGKNYETGTMLYISNDTSCRHIFCLGTTGSGKTQFLLGLMFQFAILDGGGFLFTDGKADVSVAWLVFTLLRRVGRESDMLFLNYMTGGRNMNAKESLFTKITNTTNPLIFGGAEDLKGLLVGLMRDASGDSDLWKGMAITMLGGILHALVDLRDAGELNLDIETIRDYLVLDRIVELSKMETISAIAREPILKYLKELPGYSKTDYDRGALNAKASEQHGYRQMQLAEVLSELSIVYGFIFAVKRGEINFRDLLYNRRCLFVMLPALEKNEDSLKGMGRLVLAGIKSSLATALGSEVEGVRSEIVEKRPTEFDNPFLIILDELGSYITKGLSLCLQQARSLKTSILVASQDFQSLKKGDEKEAFSLFANTSLKLCMKLEDSTETFDIFDKRAAKADRQVTSGSEKKGSSYKDSGSARTEQTSRMNIRDLVNQKPGEAHAIIESKLIRLRLFYHGMAGKGESESLYLNRFVTLLPPDGKVIKKIKKGEKQLARALKNEVKAEQFYDEAEDGLTALLDKVEEFEDHVNSDQAIAAAIGSSVANAKDVDDYLSNDLGEEDSPDVGQVQNAIHDAIFDATKDAGKDYLKANTAGSDDELDEVPGDDDEGWNRPQKPSVNTAYKGRMLSGVAAVDRNHGEPLLGAATQGEVESLLHDVMIHEWRRDGKLSSGLDMERLKPVNRVSDVAEDLGALNPEKSAKDSIEEIFGNLKGYEKPHPSKKNQDEMLAMVEDLMSRIGKPEKGED